MRWLWKDWPAPVKAGPGSSAAAERSSFPARTGRSWPRATRFTEGPAANAKGEVFFNDIPDSKTYKIGLDGKVSSVPRPTRSKANGQAFGPDGRLYAVATRHRARSSPTTPTARPTVVADGFRGNDLVVRHDGGIYVTEPERRTPADPSKVWYISPEGEKRVVDTGLKFANGMTLSPDQSLLYVAEIRSHWVYSYQIQPDGSLAHKQRYYHLHVPDTADDAGADGMRVDRDGRLYVATRMGIQVCDQAGRVNCIIPTPNGKVANLCFGGPEFDTLFATCGDASTSGRSRSRGPMPSRLPSSRRRQGYERLSDAQP